MSQLDTSIIEQLNIADSFTLAMDDEIRRDGLSGSLCGFALELDQTPDIEILEQRIQAFSQQFPLALASLKQQGKHYYWCKREESPELFFQHIETDDESKSGFHKHIIDQLINQKQSRESTTPIEFHLITTPSKVTFFIRWIHPFCDAKGADLILKYICTADKDQRKQFGLPVSKPLVNIQLDKYKWWQKVLLLLKGKRYVASLDKLKSIQAFNTDKKPEKHNFSIEKLTQAETSQVLKLAKSEVGLMGTSLYFIGCLMRALEKMHPEKPGEAYCAPYAFNLRKQRSISPVTSNHVCALFAQVPKEIVQDRSQLFTYLKQQNKDVIRQQLDYAFLPLMWAGSWLSLEEYGKILRQSSSGEERSSFWFSDIGKLDIPVQYFPGAEITNIFHLCQVTSPPALAFLSCIYQDQLTLSYNFIEPLSNAQAIKHLHQLVLEELLTETD